MSFPFYHQFDSMDCGPACLKMICRSLGKNFSIARIRELCHITREGVTMLGISDAAESLGLKSMGVSISFSELVESQPFPCIAHWQQNHFVVIYGIVRKKKQYLLRVADPAHGLISYREQDFRQAWQEENNEESKGVCLVFETTPEFNSMPEDIGKTRFSHYVTKHLRPYRLKLALLLTAMILASGLQFVFPLLTQLIVDKGIAGQNLGYITMVLLGQFALFLGMMSIEFFRSRVTVFVSSRINITMVSDFLRKLLQLPLFFFNTKLPGDLIQRINDHQRIQSFITAGLISILYSSLTLMVFGTVLAIYNFLVLAVFVLSSVGYALWIYLFMKKRRKLDYIRFSKMSENQDILIQIIHGIPELKLTGAEKQKRKQWEKVQEHLFHNQLSSLKISQYQELGSFFFLRTKDILITFITAYLVIKGELTLGMMLAVQGNLGQLNGPVEQLVSFFREFQDASIGMERIQEVNSVRDEELPESGKIHLSKPFREIRISNLTFQYDGPHSEKILDNLSLTIPSGKITAVVGKSGSGKTTLIKLLLGFYLPSSGVIRVDDTPLSDISNRHWRSLSGCVMQDGYIFSDTIEANIALGDDKPDQEKLKTSAFISNLDDFLVSLPRGLQTKIGEEGAGLSQGQKQRILIARAVYRNPEIFFFDEATNSLDSSNEKIILERLDRFYRGKTVIIVAHRLSTVKNADQIIVLDRGKISELGNHSELISKRGIYFQLVSNQLELGE